jgi:hypothetical protein
MEQVAIAVITQKIAAKRDRKLAIQTQRADLEREDGVLDVEIRTLDELLKEIAKVTGVTDTDWSQWGNTPVAPPDKPVQLDVANSDGRRGPKGVWRTLMPELVKVLGNDPDFSVAEVEGFAALVEGKSLNAATIRSQMANYVNNGWLERVREGRFRFTQEGVCRFSEPAPAPPLGVSKISLFEEDKEIRADPTSPGREMPDQS